MSDDSITLIHVPRNVKILVLDDRYGTGLYEFMALALTLHGSCQGPTAESALKGCIDDVRNFIHAGGQPHPYMNRTGNPWGIIFAQSDRRENRKLHINDKVVTLEIVYHRNGIDQVY